MNYTRTKTAFAYEGTIEDSSSKTEEFVVLGNFLLCGIVHSTKNAKITINEGIDKDNKTYIKTKTIDIKENEAKIVEEILYGKYAKITIQNDSGAQATVKAFLNYRHENLIKKGTKSSPFMSNITKVMDTIDTHSTIINSSSNYQSSWISVQEYEQLTGMIKTDKAGNFSIEYSEDATNELAEDNDTYAENDKKGFTSNVIGRYARFIFNNTSTENQTEFSYVLYGRK